MNLFLIEILFFILLFPTYTNTLRCYKCDATNVCKTARSNSLLNKNFEIVECEHYCWKSISLTNVYRGCERKRCAISHTIGTFSSSVCCQTDYCNRSKRFSTSKYLLMLTLLCIYFCCYFSD